MTPFVNPPSIFAEHPTVVGLTGAARSAAIKALHKAAKVASPPKAKMLTARELAAKVREYDQAYHAIKVVQETDQAVAIQARIDLCDVNRVKIVNAWLPKSVLREGKAPGWILSKKLEEIYAAAPTRSGGIVVTWA